MLSVIISVLGIVLLFFLIKQVFFGMIEFARYRASHPWYILSGQLVAK